MTLTGIVFVTYLLSCISFEKVHSRRWTSPIFEVDHISTLLNKRYLWPNLIIHLPLFAINRSILAVSHFASFALTIASMAHLLKVILVLLDTSLRDVPLVTGRLTALVCLSANGQHPIITLLSRVVIIVVLDVYLVIDVVHVLLL